MVVVSTGSGDEASTRGFLGQHQQGNLEQKRRDVADTIKPV